MGALTLAPLDVAVYPLISTAPADVRVTVTIARDSRNEVLCLVWDGGDAGSSCQDLLGDREPITRQIWLKSLSAGEYVLRVTLDQHLGRTYTKVIQFQVN